MFHAFLSRMMQVLFLVFSLLLLASLLVFSPVLGYDYFVRGLFSYIMLVEYAVMTRLLHRWLGGMASWRGIDWVRVLAVSLAFLVMSVLVGAFSVLVLDFRLDLVEVCLAFCIFSLAFNAVVSLVLMMRAPARTAAKRSPGRARTHRAPNTAHSRHGDVETRTGRAADRGANFAADRPADPGNRRSGVREVHLRREDGVHPDSRDARDTSISLEPVLHREERQPERFKIVYENPFRKEIERRICRNDPLFQESFP